VIWTVQEPVARIVRQVLPPTKVPRPLTIDEASNALDVFTS